MCFQKRPILISVASSLFVFKEKMQFVQNSRFSSALVCLLPFLAAPAALGATATISSSAQQTFKGWGCTPGFVDTTRTDGTQFHTLVDSERPTSIVDAVYSVGFDITRIEISPNLRNSDGSVNATALADLKKALKQSRDRGVTKWIAAVWSPPSAFTQYDSASGKQYLRADKVADFANFYVARIKDCINDGAEVPLGISAANEPDYMYTRYNLNDSTKNTWRTLVKTLRTTLNANNLWSVPILSPEGADQGVNEALLGSFQGTDGNGGYAFLESDSDLRNAIGGFATHTYSYLYPNRNTNAISRYNKPRWMTEWSIDKNQSTHLNHAFTNARHLGADLIDLRHDYWFWWLGFHQSSNGKTTENTVEVDDGQVLMWADYRATTPNYTKTGHFIKKLFSSVRPGWVVKRVTDDDSDLRSDNNDRMSQATPWLEVDLYAFENSGGTQSVMVLVNPTSNNKTMNVNGLKGGTASVHRLSSTEDMASVGSISVTGGGISNLSLPARSITLLSTSGGATMPVANGTYKILARHSGKALDVNQSTDTTLQWDDYGGNNQQWIVESLGTGYYKLRVKSSGKALDVFGNNTGNEATIGVYPYSGSNNQQWSIVDVGSGYYKVLARHSGKGLDVKAASQINGSIVHQYEYAGATNQQWSFTFLSTSLEPTHCRRYNKPTTLRPRPIEFMRRLTSDLSTSPFCQKSQLPTRGGCKPQRLRGSATKQTRTNK
jgi:hypothetical protein